MKIGARYTSREYCMVTGILFAPIARNLVLSSPLSALPLYNEAEIDEYSRGERARSLFLATALTYVYCRIFHYAIVLAWDLIRT